MTGVQTCALPIWSLVGCETLIGRDGTWSGETELSRAQNLVGRGGVFSGDVSGWAKRGLLAVFVFLGRLVPRAFFARDYPFGP